MAKQSGDDVLDGQRSGGIIQQGPLRPPGSYGLNLSGIGFDVAKMSAAPEFFGETEEYAERDRPDEKSAERTFRVPWSLRHDFRAWVLGYSTVVSQPALSASGNVDAWALSRVTPAQHPEMPWLYALECEMVRGEGAPINRLDIPLVAFPANPFPPPPQPALASVPMIAFGEMVPAEGFTDGLAVMKVTYRDRDYEIHNDVELAALGLSEIGHYVSRYPRFSLKGIELPAPLRDQLKFVPGLPSPSSFQLLPKAFMNQPIPGGAQMLLPLIGMEYLWHDVPEVPRLAIAACQGKVNADIFDAVPGGNSFPPQTLLMQAPEIKRRRNTVGRVIFDIRYRFDYNPYTWNAFPAADGNFYFVAFGGTGDIIPPAPPPAVQIVVLAAMADAAALILLDPDPAVALPANAMLEAALAGIAAATKAFGFPLAPTDAAIAEAFVTTMTPIWLASQPTFDQSMGVAAVAVTAFVEDLLETEGVLVPSLPGAVVGGRLLYPVADFNSLFLMPPPTNYQG